jgi:hypothetical protein
MWGAVHAAAGMSAWLAGHQERTTLVPGKADSEFCGPYARRCWKVEPQACPVVPRRVHG